MRTPASIGNHPIHPMLIVFPVGLLIFSLACDLVALVRDAPQPWTTVAFYTMAGGVVGALAAAIPGLVDLLSLPPGKLRRIGLAHMSINLVVVVLFAVNVWLRYGGHEVSGLPLALSVAGVVLLAVSGWLGAELVHTHRVGVADEETGIASTPGSHALDVHAPWDRARP
jgi:uncharacterized membrane protein